MNQIEQILDSALNKIRTATDADTVVGRPLNVGEDTVVIPISKLTMGFLGGGGEYGGNKKNTDTSFAGGSGGSVSITPIGFLVSRGGSVRVMPMSGAAAGENKLFGLAGEVISKLTKKGKK